MRPGVARMLMPWEPERLHEPAPVSVCRRLLSTLVPMRAIGSFSLWAIARMGNSPFGPLHPGDRRQATVIRGQGL